jgi:hypothetical protein
MGFDRPPRLFLRQDDENAANPLGKTGFYDPQAESITIYVAGRHPKDILRSLAHELMHHTQKCNGDFDNAESEGMGEQGYAQNNPHMRTMEIQAYQASIVFRDWEDSLKETIYYEHLQKGANKTMSFKEWKNEEINILLTEKWGFKFNLDKLNEAKEEKSYEAKKHECAKKSGYQWDDSVAHGNKCVRAKEEKPEKVDEAHGAMAGDEGARSTGHEGDIDYSGGGMRKGDESETRPREDFEHDEDRDSKATRAMSDLHDVLVDAGVNIDADGDEFDVEEEDEDELEERRGRGRADPRNQRGPADPRQRPMEESQLSEPQIRKLVREALKQALNRKK